MYKNLLVALIFITSTSLSYAALARDLAVIIANSDYKNSIKLEGAEAVLAASDRFSELGFETIVRRNATKSMLQETFRTLSSDAAMINRLVIMYTGHLLHDENDTYLTSVDLDEPNAKTIDIEAVPVSLLLNLLSNYQGGALLALGSGQMTGDFFNESDMGFKTADGLKPGMGTLNIPQGVTVLSGDPKKLSAALKTSFLSGLSFLDASELAADDVRADGFVSAFVGLSSKLDFLGAEVETAYWIVAQDVNTEDNYQAYLDRFPDGIFAKEAQKRINALLAETPKISPEEEAEQALALTRDERRDAQRNLTILEHDPKGIDGLFGPATRRAILSWQRANFFEETSFLDAKQIRILKEQGSTRAQELEREAERQAAIRREQDLAFWKQTGASGVEADIRVYLREFPDGIYSDEAQIKLDAFEQEKIAAASAQEKADWQSATETDTLEAYQAYQSAYPDGLFKEEADTRISDLSISPEQIAKLEKAKQTEKALGLNKGAWTVIETKLNQLSLQPGTIDGLVTEETRKAIRNYQSNAGIEATGYLTRESFSRLLLTFKL